MTRFVQALLNRTGRRSSPRTERPLPRPAPGRSAPRPGFDTDRFLRAQQGCMKSALRELRNGKKVTHWMWFVFPQLAGLGHSQRSKDFGIPSIDAAKQYLWTPKLQQNLDDALSALLLPGNAARSATDILGAVDAHKLHASITLFQQATSDQPLLDKLSAVRHRFFGGQYHAPTLRLLRAPSGRD